MPAIRSILPTRDSIQSVARQVKHAIRSTTQELTAWVSGNAVQMASMPASNSTLALPLLSRFAARLERRAQPSRSAAATQSAPAVRREPRFPSVPMVPRSPASEPIRADISTRARDRGMVPASLSACGRHAQCWEKKTAHVARRQPGFLLPARLKGVS